MGLGRVLLVDDHRALRDAVGRALRHEGYEVALATDGREALDVIAREPADHVVLDVSTPSMSGVEVCRRLRLGRDRAGVLMLTARDGISAPSVSTLRGPTGVSTLLRLSYEVLGTRALTTPPLTITGPLTRARSHSHV